MVASFFGHADVIKVLLENNALVDLKEWSYLMVASSLGYTDVVKVLLDNNAQVDLQENNGRSSLMFAVLEYEAKACNCPPPTPLFI